MFWKKDEIDFILPFQKIIDGDIMTFRFFNKLTKSEWKNFARLYKMFSLHLPSN